MKSQKETNNFCRTQGVGVSLFMYLLKPFINQIDEEKKTKIIRNWRSCN
jgi:hypothetical protein